MSDKFIEIVSILLFTSILGFNCHGWLKDPIARSSAWKINSIRPEGLKFPPYYEDNQMSCGGFDTQWSKNGGKCGICGEQYNLPKRFEKGGDLYRGYIVNNYKSGQMITVSIDITANHKGYVEFRVCNTDNLNGADANQNCLDQNLLTDANGRTRIPVDSSQIGVITYKVYLPTRLTCKHCVFQWKYNTGNSWNAGCMGCGAQEQFYGCSDISIGASNKREFDSYEVEKKEFSSSIDKKSLLEILKRFADFVNHEKSNFETRSANQLVHSNPNVEKKGYLSAIQDSGHDSDPEEDSKRFYEENLLNQEK